MKSKPSEIIEGEYSSLKKTFDEVICKTIEELKENKVPTQLNGTDYYRLQINKLEYIINQTKAEGAKEAEKNKKNIFLASGRSG